MGLSWCRAPVLLTFAVVTTAWRSVGTTGAAPAATQDREIVPAVVVLEISDARSLPRFDPAGLDCSPQTSSAVHSGGAASPANFAYLALAVDACGGISSK